METPLAMDGARPAIALPRRFCSVALLLADQAFAALHQPCFPAYRRDLESRVDCGKAMMPVPTMETDYLYSFIDLDYNCRHRLGGVGNAQQCHIAAPVAVRR
jgi:hypothetical protein